MAAGTELRELLLLIPVILLALSLHECAHGWTAERLGDPTARALGRVTLNPLKHLDPLGTVLMFVANFGWAKPTPVDPRRFRRPRRDMMWVSLAGPAANFLLGGGCALAVRLLVENGLAGPGIGGSFLSLAWLGLHLNLALAFFNLLPLHPLDGSKIVSGLLPLNWAFAWSRFERQGMMIIVAIFLLEMLTGVSIFGWVLWRPVRATERLLLGRGVAALLGGF